MSHRRWLSSMVDKHTGVNRKGLPGPQKHWARTLPALPERYSRCRFDFQRERLQLLLHYFFLSHSNHSRE